MTVAPPSTRAGPRGWRVTSGVALAAVLLVGLAGPAQAAPDLRDPNDTRGPLDVRSVDRVGGSRPIFKIVTASRWRARRLFERGFLLVHVDTFGTRRADYYALVSSNGRRMLGTLVRDRRRAQNDTRVGSLPVWRRNGRSASVRLPLARLFFGNRRLFYRWHVRTIMIKRRCWKSVCIDRGPDGGALRENLRV